MTITRTPPARTPNEGGVTTADVAGLVRSELTAVGIRRRRCGRGFRYFAADGTPLTDRAALARIKALVIPPGWEDVRISPVPLGHIQAVGTDAASTGTTTCGVSSVTDHPGTASG